jgi:hypothetical protein
VTTRSAGRPEATTAGGEIGRGEMVPSAFLDRARPPADDEVAAALGAGAAFWTALRERLGAAFAPIEEDWAYSGRRLGWALRLRRGGRPVAYLTPLAGRVRASLALPERAMAAALEVDLPEPIRTAVATAPTAAEGRAVRFEVRTDADVAAVLVLARIRAAS